MCDHSACEICGFWMAFAGWLTTVLTLIILGTGGTLSERLQRWIDVRLGIPWYIPLAVACLGFLLVPVGWHLMCIGGHGRYPGYPLDLLLRP